MQLCESNMLARTPTTCPPLNSVMGNTTATAPPPPVTAKACGTALLCESLSSSSKFWLQLVAAAAQLPQSSRAQHNPYPPITITAAAAVQILSAITTTFLLAILLTIAPTAVNVKTAAPCAPVHLLVPLLLQQQHHHV